VITSLIKSRTPTRDLLCQEGRAFSGRVPYVDDLSRSAKAPMRQTAPAIAVIDDASVRRALQRLLRKNLGKAIGRLAADGEWT
jgi:hypothetical protein